MLLGGLWHGASWNFLIWGAINGFMLAAERAQGRDSFYCKLPNRVRMLITYTIVLFTWVFFRADSLPGAWRYIKSMLGQNTEMAGASLIDGVIYNPYYLGSIILAAIVIWSFPQTWDFTKKITWMKAVYIGSIFIIALLAMTTQSYNPFIYFIF